MAKKLPSLLQLFAHATSLGGVESLVEWRTMSDDTCDRKLMRISVGIEGWQGLKGRSGTGIREIAEVRIAITMGGFSVIQIHGLASCGVTRSIIYLPLLEKYCYASRFLSD